jgi:hypothetical protein
MIGIQLAIGAVAGIIMPLAPQSPQALPKPVSQYVCGGEYWFSCLSNPDASRHNPANLTMKICDPDRTDCLKSNHWWLVTVGVVGKDGYQPFTHHADQQAFKNDDAYKIYWMRYNPAKRDYGPTQYCLWPHPSDHGVTTLILLNCRNLGKPGTKHFNQYVWVFHPDDGTIPGPVHGGVLANVYETNADPAHVEPKVMTSLMNVGDTIHTIPFYSSGTLVLDRQTWYRTSAPLH